MTAGDTPTYVPTTLQAFQQELPQHMPMLLRFTRKLSGYRSCEAEDLMQTTLLKAMEYVERRSVAPSDLRPWLMRIAYTLTIDMFRRASRHREIDGDDFFWEQIDVHAPCPSDTADLRMDAVYMLEQMSDKYRDILLLVDVQGMSYKEVSAWHDIKIGTVMSRLHNARTTARALLTQEAV